MPRRYSLTIFFLALFGLASIFIPKSASALEDSGAPVLASDIFYLGTVEARTLDPLFEDDGVSVRELLTVVRQKTGETTTIPFEYPKDTGAPWTIDVGDKVVVGQSMIADERTEYVSDAYRLPVLIFLFVGLLFGAAWCAGAHGVRSFFGLLSSIAILLWGVVPLILAGKNPVVVCLLGTILIATVSLFLAHGFRVRIFLAWVSTIVTLFLAFGFSELVLRFAHLSGVGTEEAFYLQTLLPLPIDLRGLFLGAMMIGVLGILDDVTTAQTATVEEIARANSQLTESELRQRGRSVGQEHVVSLINTLVLAYIGASFPLVLLFSLLEKPLWVLVNSEIVFEEVLRMLVGSMTLMAAVPLTTCLAAWYYARHAPREHLDNV